MNENHDEQGRFASGSSSGSKAAFDKSRSAQRIHDDPRSTHDDRIKANQKAADHHEQMAKESKAAGDHKAAAAHEESAAAHREIAKRTAQNAENDAAIKEMQGKKGTESHKPTKEDVNNAFQAWGAAGHELKPKLRSDAPLNGADAQWRDTMDHHLGTADKYQGEVHRGLRLSPDEASKLKEGGIISDKSYQSVSANLKTAENYSKPRILEEEKSQPVIVHIAAGHSGVDVSKLVGDTASKNEREVLLPRNTNLKISKVTKDKEGTIHVHASEIKPQMLHD